MAGKIPSDKEIEVQVITEEVYKNRREIIKWGLYKRYIENQELFGNPDAWKEQKTATVTTLEAAKKVLQFYERIAKEKGIEV